MKYLELKLTIYYNYYIFDMNLDNIENKCSVKNCREPIWQQNSLIYLECDHPKCRKCVLKLFLGEEWTTVQCDQCGWKGDV
jgi:hypothetical protein